ncbi:RRQRL motif-containing zinc-binding protein [Streptomyces sp. NPDC050743]|uniref:RRQRL motif-containing zinc-binding protein n=1 Tax=Streptomyces sp. NPDC050743 TaxID=3365634 RepID=UPI00378B5145
MAGIPVYRWHPACEGLATVRQLRALWLRPGGRDVATPCECPRRRHGPLVAYLYSIEQAKPAGPMTPAKRAALPPSLGMCVPCARPEEQRVAVA